jgi:hypothetical protein
VMNLTSAINILAPGWLSIPKNSEALSELDESQSQALLRLLCAEVSRESKASLREEFADELVFFDRHLNAITSSILNEYVPFNPIRSNRSEGLFLRDQEGEARELSTLEKEGYTVSRHGIPQHILRKIVDELGECTFSSRGIFKEDIRGADLFQRIQNGGEKKYGNIIGDTYWISDQGKLAESKLFQTIALDPYILSVAAGYLGCVPILDQTNVWFSFPTFNEKLNLSTNAQMFHQDKGFASFVKVFIYLNDVDQTNGPHVFVAGSHIDEAHKYGVPISARIPDDEITKYYSADRIKTLEGSAGTMLFVDTSGVHKGMPVMSGYRLLLQFEYTSSLYLSPLSPFPELSHSPEPLQSYPENVRSRVLSNYSKELMREYLSYVSSKQHPEPSRLRKVMQVVKRYLMSA